MEYYATVGYDSPWSQNRRNEVWLVKQKDSAYDVKEPNNEYGQNKDENSWKEDYETVPYEVLESKQVSMKRLHFETFYVYVNSKSKKIK